MTDKKDDDVQDDILLDGMDQLGKTIEKTGEHLDSRVSAVEAKSDKAIAELKQTMETSMDAVADKLASFQRGAEAIGRFSQTKSDTLLSAMSEDQRPIVGLLRRVESGMIDRRTGKPVTDETDPIARGAMAAWMKDAIMGQLPNKFSAVWQQSAERAHRLGEALNEFHGTTKTNLSVGTDSAGGFLVPDIIQADILRIALDSSVIFGRARKIPMTSNRLEIPNESTGVSVDWIVEAGTVTVTAAEPAFGINILDAKKLGARALITVEMVDYSLVAVFPYLMSIFGEAIGRELDQEAMEGDGTNLTGVSAAPGINTVGNEVTGATVTYTQLVTQMYAAGEESTRVGAAWFMNPGIFGSIVGLIDSNGRPLVMDGNIQNSPFPTLLGKPTYLTNVLDVTGTTGGQGQLGSIFFGDPQTLIFGMAAALRMGVSEHAQWATDQLDFKITQRVGFTVATPGAWTEGINYQIIGGT